MQLQGRGMRRQQRLEVVLQYIDAHGGEQIAVSALASMASISPFHFHRVFSSHVGEPVLGYIRRLRLEKAAWRLLFLECSVTDVAALAGYSSPAAFTRAFRARFGTTPKKFVRGVIAARPGRASGTVAFPEGPEYRRIAPMNLIAVKRRGPYDRSPWEAWRVLRDYVSHGTPGLVPPRRVGIPLDWPELTPAPLLRYEACFEHDAAAQGEFFRRQVGGGVHAVFVHRGPYQGLQAAHESVFWHWFPHGDVRLRDAQAFHIHLDPDPSGRDPATLRTEICIPVEYTQPSRAVSRNHHGLSEWGAI